jgi:hypothetical protein
MDKGPDPGIGWPAAYDLLLRSSSFMSVTETAVDQPIKRTPTRSSKAPTSRQRSDPASTFSFAFLTVEEDGPL